MRVAVAIVLTREGREVLEKLTRSKRTRVWLSQRARMVLLASTGVGELFETVVAMVRARDLLLDEHFSVDGTLIQAWASHKSFRPKDEGPDGNEVRSLCPAGR